MGVRGRASREFMLRKLVLLIGVLAVATPVFAQNETITVKRHARNSKKASGAVAFLYGELDGQPAVLRCVLSHADCKELAPGQYDIERLLDGEGSYEGCLNVDIYRLGADSSQEQPLGEYCLLEPKN